VRTLPNSQWFKGSLGFFIVVFFVIFVAITITLVAIVTFSLRQFVGQSSSGTCHQLGHAIHSFSLSQGGSAQGVVGIAIVGSSFQHWALKLLLEARRSGKSIEDWGSLNDDLDTGLKKFATAFADRAAQRRRRSIAVVAGRTSTSGAYIAASQVHEECVLFGFGY
jgi:hypothetical protein